MSRNVLPRTTPRYSSSLHRWTKSWTIADRLRDATCRWKFCWVTQDHSRSFEITPFSRAQVSISCNVSEIKQVIGRKPRISYPTCVRRPH